MRQRHGDERARRLRVPSEWMPTRETTLRRRVARVVNVISNMRPPFRAGGGMLLMLLTVVIVTGRRAHSAGAGAFMMQTSRSIGACSWTMPPPSLDDGGGKQAGLLQFRSPFRTASMRCGNESTFAGSLAMA